MTDTTVSPRVAPESYRCNPQLPATTLQASSRDAGWSALLVDHSVSTGVCDTYDTLATRDHTLVVVTHGEVDLSCRDRGVWRTSRYSPGTIGGTLAGRSDTLRWRTTRATDRFEKIHIFIPEPFFQEAAEHLRRAGGASPEHPSFSIAVADPLIAQASVALAAAARWGAPDLYAQVTARMLAVHLLMRHSERAGGDEHRATELVSDRRIARVIEYMSAHLDETISLDALAAEAAISKFHFARLFREKTGCTPVHYLTRLRLESARRLLATSDMGIAEIAAASGYPNPTHFSMAFRRFFGASPREVRRLSAGPSGAG